MTDSWTLALVLDKDNRVWQLKDKWICLSRPLVGGAPQTCVWDQLVERYGPLKHITLTDGEAGEG